jgi:hypothetical protein
MAFQLPPPPGVNEFRSASWQDWFYKLRNSLIQAFSTITLQGLPPGGDTDYVLTKDSPADYDASWQPAGAASFGPFTDDAILVATSVSTFTSLADLGTTTEVLHGNAAGVPTWGPVDLAADVTGDLPVTNLNGGTDADNTTFWRGDGVWATPAGGGGGGASPNLLHNSEFQYFNADHLSVTVSIATWSEHCFRWYANSNGNQIETSIDSDPTNPGLTITRNP